jgi:hypothetical protein
MGVYPLKYTPKRIAVGYPVRQFQKSEKPIFAVFTELLHIHKIFSATDDRTQANYQYAFQLVPQIAVRTAWIAHSP